MAQDNMVPQKLINFRAYTRGKDLLGLVDIELPKLEAMTDSIKGAGIAGELDCPTMGHFSSMELKLTWRTIEKALAELASGSQVQLDLRGAQQVYDPKTGKYEVSPVKIVVQGYPKSTELGKFETGATTGSTSVYELNYLKLTINNEDVWEVDKYNFISKFRGMDVLSAVRDALGM